MTLTRNTVTVDKEILYQKLMKNRASKTLVTKPPPPLESSLQAKPTAWDLLSFTLKLDRAVLGASVPSVLLLLLLKVFHLVLVGKGVGSEFLFMLGARAGHETATALIHGSRQYMKERLVHWPVDFGSLLAVGWKAYGWKPSLFLCAAISSLTYTGGLSCSFYFSLSTASRKPA